MTSRYRFAPPFVVRLAGLGLVAVGALVLLLLVLVLVLSLPAAVLTGGITVAVVLGLALVCLLLVLRGRDVVRLDETGYRVRWVRGAGVRQARWKDVEDVTTPTVAGQRCVQLRLRDGGTTTVPVDLVSGTAEAFVQDLRAHLDRGHGYRPLTRGGTA